MARKRELLPDKVAVLADDASDESVSFEEHVRRENAHERLAPPSPAFGPARRTCIENCIRKMLETARGNPNNAPAIVAKLEECAAAFARAPDQSHVGPYRLFMDVKRAAANLRDSLVHLIRKRAVETGEWDYSKFLFEREAKIEANRLHSDLSLGMNRTLQVSVVELSSFLSVLSLLAEASKPNLLELRGRGANEERNLLQEHILEILRSAGLPTRASILTATVLAEVNTHAFGDEIWSESAILAKLRRASGSSRKKISRSDIGKTVSRWSAAQRAARKHARRHR